jgi:hypothetical protein
VSDFRSACEIATIRAKRATEASRMARQDGTIMPIKKNQPPPDLKYFQK